MSSPSVGEDFPEGHSSRGPWVGEGGVAPGGVGRRDETLDRKGVKKNHRGQNKVVWNSVFAREGENLSREENHGLQ